MSGCIVPVRLERRSLIQVYSTAAVSRIYCDARSTTMAGFASRTSPRRDFEHILKSDDAQCLAVGVVARNADLSTGIPKGLQDVLLREVVENHDRRPASSLEGSVRPLQLKKRPDILHADRPDDGIEPAAANGQTGVPVLSRGAKVLLQTPLERDLRNPLGRDHDFLRVLVCEFERPDDDLCLTRADDPALLGIRQD